MKAIVIKQYGEPEVLVIEERPKPDVTIGQVLIEVKSFGINHAEIYFRQGIWGDVAEISGIECVGIVSSDPSGTLKTGQKVIAIVGGMGRSINGSYAEYTAVPLSNVAAISSNLPWEVLAAIPESYATAWSCLSGNLALSSGQVILIRGGTSALGRAAINLAAHLGARVIATTRNPARAADLKSIGAHEVMIESPQLVDQVQAGYPHGVDSVLDIIGNTTVIESLALTRRDGRVCLAGFLGGGGPFTYFEPVFQIPSQRQLSVFASALVIGNAEFPITEIPFQDFVDGVEQEIYKVTPAHVFDFEHIQDAHRLVESGQANGKIVIRL